MMNFLIIITSSILLSLATCSKERKCGEKEIMMEKIYTIPLNNDGKVSFQHVVLMDGLKHICLDSTIIMNLVNKYINDQTDDIPISSLEIFKSKRGYDSGETLSQSKEFYKESLLAIWFNVESRKPYKFIFYRNGHSVYEGHNWNH